MIKGVKNILRKTPLFEPIKESYYFSRRTARKIYNSIFPTAFILLYHRIAVSENDINRLSVSPENFESQIKYLKSRFNIVSLRELANDIKARKIKNNSVAITFDDGYADNLHNALPILEKYETPATILITAGKVGDNAPFFWEADMAEKDRGRCINPDELRRLALNPLIEIGAHTVTHPKLCKISIEEQDKEVSESKLLLEKATGKPVNAFAYPFGGKATFDEDTVNLVKKSYDYACANIHRRVNANSSPYALPRFIVRNWTAEELEKEMKKWL